MLTRFDPQPLPGTRPGSLTDPFAPGPPHPLARCAAELVQAELRAGLDGVDLAGLAQPGRGKMFGVLVGEDVAGRVGYLRAFSGMLDGRWTLPGFAPPLFDLQERATWFPACEAEWDAWDEEVTALTSGPMATALQEALEAQAIAHAAQKDALRARHAENRRTRREARARLLEGGDTEDTARALHALGQQSRGDEVEQRALFAALRTEREVLLAKQRALAAQRSELSERRTTHSRAAWRRMTDEYRLPNARGERRTLTSLYDPEPVPGGAGDCAAPKLIGWAYALGIRPLALAEFWWGATPVTEERHAGQYYPACDRKCGRVLPWMLQGL